MARSTRLIACDCIPNLVANGAPFSRINHWYWCDRVSSSRVERRIAGCCAEATVDLVGGVGCMPNCAWRVGDLEQQSGRCRDDACRTRSSDAMFWREHVWALLADFTNRDS